MAVVIRCCAVVICTNVAFTEQCKKMSYTLLLKCRRFKSTICNHCVFNLSPVAFVLQQALLTLSTHLAPFFLQDTGQLCQMLKLCNSTTAAVTQPIEV